MLSVLAWYYNVTILKNSKQRSPDPRSWQFKAIKEIQNDFS